MSNQKGVANNYYNPRPEKCACCGASSKMNLIESGDIRCCKCNELGLLMLDGEEFFTITNFIKTNNTNNCGTDYEDLVLVAHLKPGEVVLIGLTWIRRIDGLTADEVAQYRKEDGPKTVVPNKMDGCLVLSLTIDEAEAVLPLLRIIKDNSKIDRPNNYYIYRGDLVIGDDEMIALTSALVKAEKIEGMVDKIQDLAAQATPDTDG